jgi:hypothetical protein
VQKLRICASAQSFQSQNHLFINERHALRIWRSALQSVICARNIVRDAQHVDDAPQTP